MNDNTTPWPGMVDAEQGSYGRAAHWQIESHRGQGKHNLNKLPIEDYPKTDKLPGDFDGWSRGHGTEYPWLAKVLRQGVGRPWAKVHSEIVARLKRDYTEAQRHDIMGTLQWYVEENPIDVGDGQYVQSNGHPFYAHRKHSSWGSYMVHPVTKLLMLPKEEWTKIRFQKPGDHRWYKDEETFYDRNHYYRKIKGIWYEVMLAPVPKRPKDFREDRCCSYWKDEKDWLWQMNLVDAVTKSRLRSHDLHNLALTHGHMTYDNKLITDKQYQEKISKMLRSNYYVASGYSPFIGERSVYAKSLRQISEAEKRRLGITTAKLTVPDIVRKHK